MFYLGTLYNALSNLAIEINFTDHIKENYAISDDIIYINVKEDIDKLKAKEEIISNAPNLEIIGVNGSGAHNMNVSIKKGGSITYLISGDYFKQVLSSRNLKGTCTSKSITTTKAEYKCTYNTTLAKFTPSMKVEDTNSSVFFPQAPKVEVIEDNNNAPSITIIEDENIYTKGQKIYLKASASDDGYISSTIWETYRSELKIFNKNSIDKAYFYAPTLLQNRRIYFFKITVLDNHKRSTSKIYAIKVQGDTSIKKEIKYISDINYADTCSSFTQTNCGYKITDISLEKITKKWKYKNTGNVDLKSIKFYTETKSDFIGTLQIGNPSSASIIRQDSDFEISVDISIPKNMIDGEYTRKWILKDNFGNNIKFSNGNIAIMFFKFKLQRGITSESLSLEDLLLGKTLYEKCENHVNTLVFQHNGKIKSIEKNDIKYIPYSIAGNIITTSDEEGEETKTLKSSSSKYIKLEENNEDITTFYFSKNDANHAPFNNDCNDEDDDNNGVLVKDLVSGHIDFKDNENKTISVPNDAWIRIVPKIWQNGNNWNGPKCKINSSGNFGSECYVHKDLSMIRSAFTSSEKYQVVIYKETTNNHQWNKEESSYFHLGNEVEYEAWSNFSTYKSSEVATESKFTRLNFNGSTHTGTSYSSSPWSCVKDSTTKLVWEVKTKSSGIHNKDNTYQWGGISAIGRDDTPRVGKYYDDWNSLVNGANAESLCGFTNWRVPTPNELRSIVDSDKTDPSINTAYFPNTVSHFFWSSSPLLRFSNKHASFVVFSHSDTGLFDAYYDRNDDKAVRLVRGGE